MEKKLYDIWDLLKRSMLERKGNGGGCSGNKISCVFTYEYIKVHSINTIILLLMNTILWEMSQEKVSKICP